MLARSVRKHPSLKDIQVVPLGLDYEDYVEWRRRLRVRAGEPVPFADLLQEDGTMDKVAFNARVKRAFQKVMVDIQPEEAQPVLHPAGRALRTTEMTTEQWRSFTDTLRTWEERWQDDPDWANDVKIAFDDWKTAWERLERKGRPEAWGTAPSKIRTQRAWVQWMRPLFLLANLPSWPATAFITSHVNRSVKKLEFVATMRFGYGILLIPLTWLIWSGFAAWQLLKDGPTRPPCGCGVKAVLNCTLGPKPNSRSARPSGRRAFWNGKKFARLCGTLPRCVAGWTG